ncbi:DUF2070 family protein [Candidatus Micrarchaeota archaeon]|nr:DUF2070 family protein [Candidatus Micrarchaeota archaeon]
MTQNIKKAVDVTNYLVALPSSRYLLSAILFLGILLGIFAEYSGEFNFDLITQGAMTGIFILTIPAFLSAATIKLMIRKVSFKRILATTLIGEILYALTYSLSIFLSMSSVQYSQFAVFIGSAFVFVIWYAVARIFFVLKWRSFLFAIVQLIFHAFFLMSSTVIDLGASPVSILIKFYVSALVLLGAIYIFFAIINAPMKRNFGYSSIDAFSMFMSQWLYDKKDIEEAFEAVGERVKTILSAFVFERKNDRIVFLTPYVHYGPFGNLGGSQFSRLLSSKIKKKYGASTFVFHGTVTHDLNPSSSDEISRIMNAFDKMYANGSPKPSKISFSKGVYKECTADALLFDDGAFIGVSRAPRVTEDINFGLGLSMISKAENFVKSATVVDQHNAETGEVTSFEPGSEVGYNYTHAVVNSLTEKTKPLPLKIGISEKSVKSEFIGGANIKIAIFSSSPKYILVLIDSNGITPEFKSRIEEEIRKIGREHNEEWEVGVYTTDTHEINTVQGVLNPLREDPAIIDEIKKGVIEAHKDLQPAKCCALKEWFNIDVLGPKQSIEIISTINSIIAVSKIAAPLIIFGAVIAILWILSRL